MPSPTVLGAQLRIARPVSALERSVWMYAQGLGLEEIGRFADHGGFDGVMLGGAGSAYHLEFTCHRAHPIVPAPSVEDLLVFYLPHRDEWHAVREAMIGAGFAEVAPFNAYWGRTRMHVPGSRRISHRTRMRRVDCATTLNAPTTVGTRARYSTYVAAVPARPYVDTRRDAPSRIPALPAR